MALSTNLISGLSSGFDWRSMIDQLMQIEHARVDLVTDKKTETESKLTEWQSLNSKLLSLKTAVGTLKDTDDFNIFKASMTTNSSTVEASDLLNVSTSDTASIGSYSLKINNLAAAQKLSSGSFASISDELGSDYSGDILINGTVINIAATDTLADVSDKINNANSGSNPTGVTASIISYGTADHRMILTSDTTGASGIGLQNAGASDILYGLGFLDASRTAKNHLTGGDQTDGFSSTSISIKSLLNLSTTQTSSAGEIIINGMSIGDIDLSTDTLSSLRTKFAAAGLTASITSETENDNTYYRLMVEGAANTYTDKNNILETLGIIKGGVSDESGATGDIENTSGGAVIASDTLIKDIDGYTGYLNTDYIHLEGTDTNNNPVTDDTLIINDTTTIEELLTKIESVFGDVTASINGDGELMVVDNTSGASYLDITIGVKDSGGADDNTLKFDTDGILDTTARKREIVAGADASITLDGVTVTRSDNTIDDIVSGVTLNLQKADAETTVSLNISRDTDAIISNISGFVSSYNSISSYIQSQISYDDTTQETGGILFGDGTLISVKSDLTSILTQSIWGVSYDYSTMGLVGINVDNDGKLNIDNAKLSGYLKSNFNDVKKLFTASSEASVGTIKYLEHSNDTNYGDYEVNIDTAAAQSTSDASDNTSLSGDETLTITEGSGVAVVGLTSSMTMPQMVNAVNSELTTVYTQILSGSEQLYADSGQAAAINPTTKWDSIYNSTGDYANLVNGDVISFSGIARNGVEINGSYTISDIATDSVQELLSSIETAFGNNVTANISSSGQILITDSDSGASNVSLTFDFTSAHDLDFGTALTTNTGGQAGRYAMDITASVDAGNHMVLTHNNYGTGNAFTISQVNNLLWTGGDQTVDNGVDVAGTINGETATGTGQILRGDSGEANIDGLAIRYTGTTTGEIGNIKLTLGAAELFDRKLFDITDKYEGYVGYKQESLKNNIESYGIQIDQMEDRLNRKMEMMINRFVAMETALAKIQSQSDWLAGQISASYNGWV
ncbi:MAG: flagellar filament capping protein FliD [Pseudomonadota bacterium]